MALIPGTVLTMNASGVVSGTANSMALARGQANAARTIAPALAAIDAQVAAPDNPLDANAAVDMKQALVDAWNDTQAPLILDDCAAICAHLAANMELDGQAIVDFGNLQRLPSDPSIAFAPTIAPLAPVFIPVTGSVA